MTDDPRLAASESARLFRQRLEMGADEIVLDGMTRDEALSLLREARRAGETGGSAGGARSEAAPVEDLPARRSPSGDGQGSSSGAGPDGSSGDPKGSPSMEPAASDGVAVDPDAPLPDDYDRLRELALGCTRCGLSKNRTQVVFSDGPREARLMVVGEAPGANEDRTGVPFVGAAGKYLDILLAAVGLSREESVYIANVLKCRPPGNRDPKPDEIETCSPYLRKQIELVKPRVLLAVGSFSGKLLTGRDKVSLGRLRGEVHSYHGVPLVVTYHPAALLRNSRWTRLFWEDLQLLRDVMDRETPEAS